MSTLCHIAVVRVALLAMLIMGCGQSLDERIQQGLDLTEQKNYAAAIQHFDQLITEHPEAAEAWNGRGLARKASGDAAGALEDYNQAIELDPNGAYPFNNRGTLLWANGDLLGAMKDFDSTLSLDPKYDLAYYNRAQLRITNGDHAGALKDLDSLKALVGEEQYPDYFFHRGYAEGALHLFEPAEADFSRYLSKSGNAPWVGRAYGQRGMNRLNLHRYDSALADLRRAESKGQRDKDILYYQGYALSALGRWEEALEVTIKTLELDPNFPEARWGLGRCFEEVGKRNEACQAYRDAISLGHIDTEGAVDRVCK